MPAAKASAAWSSNSKRSHRRLIRARRCEAVIYGKVVEADHPDAVRVPDRVGQVIGEEEQTSSRDRADYPAGRLAEQLVTGLEEARQAAHAPAERLR
jgi:hypothetical protein